LSYTPQGSTKFIGVILAAGSRRAKFKVKIQEKRVNFSFLSALLKAFGRTGDGNNCGRAGNNIKKFSR